MEQQPTTAASHQWPAGAWFGTQFGCTAWLLTGAIEVSQSAPAVAALWAAAFVALNALGVWLWRSRERVGQVRAAQLLLVALGAAGLLALAVLDFAGPAGGEKVPAGMYLGMLVLPAIAVALGVFGRPRAAGAAHGP